MNSLRYLYIGGFVLAGLLVGCGAETTTSGNGATEEAASALNETSDSTANEAADLLGTIETDVNGRSTRFEILPDSDTNLVPVVQAVRIEGKDEAGNSLLIVFNPVDLDDLELPATLQNEGAEALKPGQLPSSLSTVILQYTDQDGMEYTSGADQTIHIEQWRDRTLTGSFPGADLNARRGGTATVGEGQVTVRFPN